MVLLHTNGCFWAFSYDRYWLTANVIESVFYFAVPIFFMISGATLIDYRSRYSTATFFKRRILRVVVPFVFWSCVAAIFVYVTSATLPVSVTEVISKLINTEYFSIFWFFPPLFAVYLAIPFISLISEKARKTAYGYAIIVAFATISLLPFILGLLGITYPGGLRFTAGAEYLMYVLVGYWISHYEIPARWRYALYVLGFAGLLAHIFGTWSLSYQAGEIIGTYKGYLNVPCVLYSTAIFVAARYLEGTKFMNGFVKLCKPFAGLTFGVYLLQGFFLQSVGLYTTIDTHTIVYRFGGGVVIFMLCCAITWVFKQIPLLRHLV